MKREKQEPLSNWDELDRRSYFPVRISGNKAYIITRRWYLYEYDLDEFNQSSSTKIREGDAMEN